MGKSYIKKKTRWRSFELNGSTESKETSSLETTGKVPLATAASIPNGANTSYTKYSQILSDQQQSYSSKSSSYHYTNKRGINKENGYSSFYANVKPKFHQKVNQFHHPTTAKGGTSLVSGRDKRSNSSATVIAAALTNPSETESKPAPAQLFNEDEYTRITTPRQDVLFKKGYLSRMNSTKTASDPSDSSTVSPATTPSVMDHAKNASNQASPDMMDYPFYYSGYYDENGVFIVNPFYANGYNYYGSNCGNSATSPMYLMPYPCYSYDYIVPSPPVSPSVGEDSTIESTETNANHTSNNNHSSENGTCTPISSSEDGVSSSNHGEEIKEDSNNIPDLSDNASNASASSVTPRSSLPNHPAISSDANGFAYPTPNYNGYYNNFFFYDGRMAGNQNGHRLPPKMKKRKKFANRSSQHSTETTTDYSGEDEENYSYKRYDFPPRFNGYQPHHHHYVNNHMPPMDLNSLVMHTNLKVDVQEFVPRIVEADIIESAVIGDLVPKQANKTETSGGEAKSKESSHLATKPIQTSNDSTIKVKHASQTKANVRSNKKEIIASTKSMEMQNIDLMNHKLTLNAPTPLHDEWNVIKSTKGNRIKFSHKNGGNENHQDKKQQIKPEISEDAPNVDQVEASDPELIVEEKTCNSSRTSISSLGTPKEIKANIVKAKKTKPKNKKGRKITSGAKLDGFEIIEPDFGNTVNSVLTKDEELVKSDADESLKHEDEMAIENESESVLLPSEDADDEALITELDGMDESLLNLLQSTQIHDDVIDINDHDIHCSIKEPVLPVLEKILEEKSIELNEIQITVNNPVEEVSEIIMEVTEPQQEVFHPEIVAKLILAPEIVVKEEIVQTILESEIIIEEVIPEKVKVPEEQERKIEKVTKELNLEVQSKIVVKKIAKKVQEPGLIKKVKEVKAEKPKPPKFEERSTFHQKENIAELERDLMENLKRFDAGADELKSPIIMKNLITDFPITNAIMQWLSEKQNENFDSLFRVHDPRVVEKVLMSSSSDLKKLQLSDDEDESGVMTDTDSDYSSDDFLKLSPVSTSDGKNKKMASIKCSTSKPANNLVKLQEKLCLIM